MYATIGFVLFTNRFDEPLYLLWIHRCFSFYSWLYGYNFTIFKILIFKFSYYFSCIPGTHNSHGVRWLFFYVYYVNVHFNRKKPRQVALQCNFKCTSLSSEFSTESLVEFYLETRLDRLFRRSDQEVFHQNGVCKSFIKFS